MALSGSFSDGPLSIRLGTNSRAEVLSGQIGKSPHAVFLPPREVLSIYEGFIGTYERRELSFDETVYDLCLALNAPPMRGKQLSAEAEWLLKPLKDVLPGVSLKGKRFYLREPRQEWMEANLAADGLRKVGTLKHLISNGSLAANGVLFWDEPETNLNPKLITVLAGVLTKLASAGVQVFIATHDYLLVDELSLAAEYRTPDGVAAKTRFFCLVRPSSREPIQVQFGDTLTEIEANPILEEFSAHYERERDLFYGQGPVEVAESKK